MKDRRKQFLETIIEIYKQTGEPVHYSDVATKMNVSSFTAYDAVLDLERKGFLRKVFSAHESKGKARAYFEPVDNLVLTQTEEKTGLVDAISYTNFGLILALTHKKEIIKSLREDFKPLNAENLDEFCDLLFGGLVKDRRLGLPIRSLLESRKIQQIAIRLHEILENLNMFEKKILVTTIENFIKVVELTLFGGGV